MLNEERVVLMTKMASYEANEGKKSLAIGSYFRSDYIGWQVLKSIISATIAFVVVFAMYILYDGDLQDGSSGICQECPVLLPGDGGSLRLHLLCGVLGEIQSRKEEPADIPLQFAASCFLIQK